MWDNKSVRFFPFLQWCERRSRPLFSEDEVLMFRDNELLALASYRAMEDDEKEAVNLLSQSLFRFFLIRKRRQGLKDLAHRSLPQQQDEPLLGGREVVQG